jgi:MFS family permease
MLWHKAKVKTGEIIFMLFMLAPTVLMGVFKVWPLFWVFMIFNVIFGIVEFTLNATKGYTVSQHFWAFSKKNKGKAIAILGSMAAMWAALIFHLAEKMK